MDEEDERRFQHRLLRSTGMYLDIAYRQLQTHWRNHQCILLSEIQTDNMTLIFDSELRQEYLVI